MKVLDARNILQFFTDSTCPPEEQGGPNLDGTWPAELLSFAAACRDHVDLADQILFPLTLPVFSVTTREARLDAIRKLARYARIKSSAMNYRSSGDISEAMKKEEMCERIYDTLPPFARW